MCMQVYVHSLPLAAGANSNADTSAQISTFKHYSPPEEMRAPWRSVWFQSKDCGRARGAWNILHQKPRKCSNDNEDLEAQKEAGGTALATTDRTWT